MSIAEPDSFIALKPCGCLAMAVVDDPDHKRETAKEVARAIRLGESVSKVPSEQVRTMDWQCESHRKHKETTL